MLGLVQDLAEVSSILIHLMEEAYEQRDTPQENPSFGSCFEDLVMVSLMIDTIKKYIKYRLCFH